MEGFSFHATVHGHSHKATGLECQDWSGSVALPELGAHVFAVADGHGDASCLRSEKGSKVAVEACASTLRSLAKEYAHTREKLLNDEGGARTLDALRTDIVRLWRKEVLAHYDANPLSVEQLEAMGQKARRFAAERPEHLYGTTLVAGLLLPPVLVLVQQGDGFCVVVDRGGARCMPIPEDELCVGNRTTSLCDTDAAQRMRVIATDMRKDGPMACVVGTDGLDKSLSGVEGLLDYVDGVMLEVLAAPCANTLEVRLQDGLRTLSERGSGDDISLAGFVDAEAVAKRAGSLYARRVRFQEDAELLRLTNKLKSMQRLHDRYMSTDCEDEDSSRRREAFMEEYASTQQRVRELQDGMDEDSVSRQPEKAIVSREQVQAPAQVSARVPAHTQTQVQAVVPAIEASRASNHQAQPERRTPLVLVPIAVLVALVALVAAIWLGFAVGGNERPSPANQYEPIGQSKQAPSRAEEHNAPTRAEEGEPTESSSSWEEAEPSTAPEGLPSQEDGNPHPSTR